MTDIVYVVSKHTRKAYHTDHDCPRLNRSPRIREVDRDDPLLNDLKLCPACEGTRAPGGREGKNFATLVRETDPDAI